MFKIDKSSVDYIGHNMSRYAIEDESREEEIQKSSHALEEREREIAANIRGQAEKDAENLLREAREQAELFKKRAWEEGYSAGIARGEEDYKSNKDHELGLREAFLRSLEDFKLGLKDELEEGILQLSFDIAEKILNKAIERDDNIFKDIIKASLENIEDDSKVVIRLSSQDYENFFSGPDFSKEDLAKNLEVDILRDDNLKPLDCIIEFDNGIIDAGVSSQLKLIHWALNGGSDAR